MSLERQRPTEITKSQQSENAGLGTERILKGLGNLGVQFNQPAEIAIRNLPLTLEPISVPASRTVTFLPYLDETNLVYDSPIMINSGSYYFIKADALFEDQPFRMSIFTGHKGREHRGPDTLILYLPFAIKSNKEMLLGDLPPNFTSVGFSYDFSRNPQLKNRLSAVARKRIPVEVVSGHERSLVIGQDTPEGIKTRISLNLQNPNPQNHLKCYEVEVFSGGNKNSPNTPQIAPETIWQAQENHYCMVDGKSYPLVPIELDKISKLTMEISYHGDTPQVMFDLLGNFPLSIDWTNQWYASTGRPFEIGNVVLLFKPEWGDENAALTYRQDSSKRISANAIHSAVIQLSTLKKDLTERLAV